MNKHLALISFKKVPLPADAWWLSAYEVFDGNQRLGFVWSQRTFTYRGTGGWDRGTRIRDYHPIRWRSARKLDQFAPAVNLYSRRTAANDLLHSHRAAFALSAESEARR